MSATVVVAGPVVPSGTVYVFNRAVSRSNPQHNPYIDRLCETWLSFVERLECHADAPFLTDLLQKPLEVDAIGQMGTASRVYCLLRSVLEPLARRILVLLSVLDDRHGIACMLNVSRALSVGSLVLEQGVLCAPTAVTVRSCACGACVYAPANVLCVQRYYCSDPSRAWMAYTASHRRMSKCRRCISACQLGFRPPPSYPRSPSPSSVTADSIHHSCA